MKCPFCNNENLHHMEMWGNDKVIVWTIVCEDCLQIKNKRRMKNVS